MLCDFHVHSHHSDGEFSPSHVVDALANAGVEAFALTDHDTTAGHAEAAQRAKERGIAFVGGIEMTSYANGQVVHVLGLGIRNAGATLADANRVAMAVWADNQRLWVRALEADGAAVTQALLDDAPLRLPVLIERLCRCGVDEGDPARCYTRFKTFFAGLGDVVYARLPSPALAAATIRASGGVAILAHPDRLRVNGLARRLLVDLDGIEAMYAAYDHSQRAALRALAAQSEKLYSCGSDYHGFFNGAYVNPRFEAPPELLARLGLM